MKEFAERKKLDFCGNFNWSLTQQTFCWDIQIFWKILQIIGIFLEKKNFVELDPILAPCDFKLIT